MSGILDNKTRVFDAGVTLVGRENLARAGSLGIEFYSFTDEGAFYEIDVASGSSDITRRITFEQSNLPQDRVTFSASESGELSAFDNSSLGQIANGRIVSYTLSALSSSILTGSAVTIEQTSGEEILAASSQLFMSTLDSLEKQSVLVTEDSIFSDSEFLVSPDQVSFVVSNSRPIPDRKNWIIDPENVDSLFSDVRFSRLKNFKYLPPLNSTVDDNIDRADVRATAQWRLGDYRPFKESLTTTLTPSSLEQELAHVEKIGCSKALSLEPTTRKNTVLFQCFDVSSDIVRKMDVVDYGVYSWKGSQKRALFLGRVIEDSKGTHSFLHMFTLVFG